VKGTLQSWMSAYTRSLSAGLQVSPSLNSGTDLPVSASAALMANCPSGT